MCPGVRKMELEGRDCSGVGWDRMGTLGRPHSMITEIYAPKKCGMLRSSPGSACKMELGAFFPWSGGTGTLE